MKYAIGLLFLLLSIAAAITIFTTRDEVVKLLLVPCLFIALALSYLFINLKPKS